MDIRSIEPIAYSLLRIVAGFTFSLHGFQKLFGWFGGMGGAGATAPMFSLIWVASVLESVGGVLILFGLFTRPVAFILSGEMAFAYFMGHASRSFWPILNAGELAVLYCFLFLYMFAAGPGIWSLDRLLRRKTRS